MIGPANITRRSLANAFRLDRALVYLVLQHGMSDCRLVEALVYCAPASAQVIALHFALLSRNPGVIQADTDLGWVAHRVFVQGQLQLVWKICVHYTTVYFEGLNQKGRFGFGFKQLERSMEPQTMAKQILEI